MVILPSHHDLQDTVQLGSFDVSKHPDSAPDQGLNSEHFNAKVINTGLGDWRFQGDLVQVRS